ncbi:MAG TPA: dienelactone hydrolase family protein [Xanthomonadales bacterium]|nr:dienelactone hydrolase family protein [Xanthomonadales bacterium]
MLETVEIETGASPDRAVIWLHGLGADGHDFEPVVPHLLWPGAPAIRFVFPHAEVRPVTINGGMSMRAWYDIVSIDGDRGHDAAGIERSMQQTRELIAREVERGIAPERIVLAGFSQGGAIAVQVALRHQPLLAGLMALSTYLLQPESLQSEAGGLTKVPAFVAHGQVDPVVPVAMGKAVANSLRELGCEVTWKTYPIPHSVSMDEIRDISSWLQARLG